MTFRHRASCFLLFFVAALLAAASIVVLVAALDHPPHRHGRHQHENEHRQQQQQEQRPTFRCMHDDPEHQRILEQHAAQTFQQQQQQQHLRPAKAQSGSSPAGIRIVLSTLDLTTEGKYCGAAGQTRPGYKTADTITCREEDVLTAEKRSVLVDKILPAATKLLKSVLMVEEPLSELVVPAGSCPGLGYTIPTAHTVSPGVENADFVLYVSATRTPEGVLAFAGTCVNDPSTGRALVGRVQFGAEYLKWSDTDELANNNVAQTAAHEIMHSLGFSYGTFVNRGLVSTVSRRGKDVTIFNGTKAIAAARAAFDCPAGLSTSPVELEDEGPEGSKLSHLDKRLFADEIMAASQGVLLSHVSVAMLEDLGVGFVANEDSSAWQNTTFGWRAGCAFLTEQCDEPANKKYFCFDESVTDECSFDYGHSGSCYVQEYSDVLPSHFRYFSDNSKKGGRQFLDYCPVIEAYSNRVCNEKRDSSSIEYTLGFTFTEMSRCFRTKNILADSFVVEELGKTRCFISRCATGADGKKIVQFRINESDWIDCTKDGEAITGDALEKARYGSVDGATVYCPNIEDFCFWYERIEERPGPRLRNASYVPPQTSSSLASFLDSLGLGGVLGLAIGGGVLLILLALTIWCLCKGNDGKRDQQPARSRVATDPNRREDHESSRKVFNPLYGDVTTV
jgi:leishmanolysin